MSEEKTDNILDCVDEEVQEIDPREESAKKNDKPTLDETVQKLIGKAGNHMESTLIAAYVGLVMGYLVQNSDDYECRVRMIFIGMQILSTLNFALDKRISAIERFQRCCGCPCKASQLYENDFDRNSSQ